MKLKLDMWRHLLDVYTKFQTNISKHVQTSLESYSLAASSGNTPSQVFSSARGPKIAQPWRKSIGMKTLTVYVCVPNLRHLYDFKAMNADKWLWPIFGCKVDQSFPIGMKLELDV